MSLLPTVLRSLCVPVVKSLCTFLPNTHKKEKYHKKRKNFIVIDDAYKSRISIQIKFNKGTLSFICAIIYDETYMMKNGGD